jgi:adenosylhomocysteinase
MKDGAMICNSGHFNVELALEDLAAAGKQINRKVREFVYEYVLPDGNRPLRPGRGPPDQPGRAHGHPASVMDMSFARRRCRPNGRSRQSDNLEHRVYDVPKAVDEWVARLKLQTMGIAIDL